MRDLGWQRINPDEYRASHARLGGSVITHPDVLDFLHARAALKPVYLGHAGAQGLLAGALCRWGRDLAGDERALRRLQPRYDFGAPEIILPLQSEARLPAWLLARTSHLSMRHAGAFRNLLQVRAARRHLALAKPLGGAGISARTQRKRRAAWQQFQDAGGWATSVQAHDPGTLADVYTDLFHSRWGCAPAPRDALLDLVTALRHLLFGHVLWLRGNPVAFDLVLMADSPGWLSADCINGAVDPRCKALSPGSVLLWLNLAEAHVRAQSRAVPLRFGLGHFDRPYKATWCEREPLLRTLTW